MAMDKWVFINEEFIKEKEACLHYTDLSIQRAYGVFDFFRVIDKNPVFLEDHLQRFYTSAEAMQLTVKLSKPDLISIFHLLIERNRIINCGTRITLTGGYSSDGYQISSPNLIISTQPLQLPNEEQLQKGIKLLTYEHQRQLPGIKTIDYLMAIYLQPLLRKHQADDVLYHHNGVVTECPRSNFFIVDKEDKIVTPSTNILKGITRMKIKQLVPGLEEKNITIADIRTAKAAFITSSTKMILPVAQIDDVIFSKENNKWIKKLTDDFQKTVNNIVHAIQPNA